MSAVTFIAIRVEHGLAPMQRSGSNTSLSGLAPMQRSGSNTSLSGLAHELAGIGVVLQAQDEVRTSGSRVSQRNAALRDAS